MKENNVNNLSARLLAAVNACEANKMPGTAKLLREAAAALSAPAARNGVDEVAFWRETYRQHIEAEASRAGYPTTAAKCFAHNAILEVEGRIANAALTRQPVAGDGMVLVPREPSPEQVRAGTLTGILTPNQASAAYQAMLAAAPAATPTDR